MNHKEQTSENIKPAIVRRLVRKRLIQVLVLLAVMAVVLLIAAGDLYWPMAWLYFGIYLLLLVVNFVILLRKSPEVIAERAEVKEGAQSWDKLPAFIVGLVGPVVILLVAGLDRRFDWSPPLADSSLWIAGAVAALGFALFTWAIVSNKFFSGVVRIQAEREHTVQSGGPYRFVRHPGYTGIGVHSLATPIVLGSTWGLIPAVLAVMVLIYRTAREDRFLQNELDGYRDYTHQTRYRLLPGVW